MPAAAESVALVRGLVATVLRTWCSAVDVQVALLLVSEVFTNAYQHATPDMARGIGMIEVEVAETFDGVHVEVHDPDHSSRRAVTVNRVDPAWAEAGRGLMLVAALADQWGAIKTLSGKCVYFDLSDGPVADDIAPQGTDIRRSNNTLACADDRRTPVVSSQISAQT